MHLWNREQILDLIYDSTRISDGAQTVLWDSTMYLPIKTCSALAAVFLGVGKSSCMLARTSNFVLSARILFAPRP